MINYWKEEYLREREKRYYMSRINNINIDEIYKNRELNEISQKFSTNKFLSTRRRKNLRIFSKIRSKFIFNSLYFSCKLIISKIFYILRKRLPWKYHRFQSHASPFLG